MYKILFSIPVHESPETIIDQVINYRIFNDDCAIVLHISNSFSYKGSKYSKKTFEKELKRFSNVYVNPNHLRTGYADIIQAHISNFKYALSIMDFEYFSIGASNDLFVKKGLYSLIKDYDAGYNKKFNMKDIEWIWYKACFQDAPLKKMLMRYDKDIDSVLICQIEGCFYKKDMFNDIVRNILLYYDYTRYDFKRQDKDKLFPREEVYFSTLADVMFPDARVLYENYAFVAFDIRVSHIPKLSDIKRYANDMSNIYNVKRINRALNNPFRSYIRDNIGEYYEEVRKIIKDVKKCNYLHLYAWNFCIVVNNCKLANWIRRVIRKMLRF